MTGPNPQEGGKHTPGEWVFDWDDFHGRHVIRMGEAVESPHNYESQCAIEYDHGCYPDSEPEQFVEAEANARLIAAAPALLKALRGLVPTNMGTPPASIPDDQILPVDMTVGELRKALSALLQATGGENGR